MKKALFFLFPLFSFCAMAQVKQNITYDVSSRDSIVVITTTTTDILENVTAEQVSAKIAELQKQADDLEKKRAELLAHIATFQDLKGRIEQEVKSRKKTTAALPQPQVTKLQDLKNIPSPPKRK
jgi:F0F1-type ATP synthase alpha subunit